MPIVVLINVNLKDRGARAANMLKASFCPNPFLLPGVLFCCNLVYRSFMRNYKFKKTDTLDLKKFESTRSILKMHHYTQSP